MVTKRTTDKGAPESPTSASSWKAKTIGGTLVTVPSGNTARIRIPGMEVFLTEGIIPNGLMPIVQEWMSKGLAPNDDTLKDLIKDNERISQVIELANAITIYCCLDPVVVAIPKDDQGDIIPVGDSRRDADTLYIDEVDFQDRMFIFNVAVGGTSNLERFREEQKSRVETLSGS
jgi:hypothetical protein